MAALEGFDLMNTFDYSNIEELDPSIADDYRVLYDREVPFELRVQEGTDGPQQVGTLEAIKVKVLVQGEDAQPQGVRVELSSEADLFFHYMHIIDEAGFREMQEQQKLMVEFADYPAVLVRMLNHCIREPHSHLAVYVMQQDSTARLDFIQVRANIGSSTASSCQRALESLSRLHLLSSSCLWY
eukprot:19807-Heterococcus_DN1.PRE.4